MRQLTNISVLTLLCFIGACASDKRYPLTGQVLAVDPSRQELTVKHEDVRGFMPGMTMPFKVRDAKTLAERKPGDLITATLVVGEVAPVPEHG